MQFRKKLGIAYFNQGFFNIGVTYSDYFGDHSSPISVQLGDSGNIVNGYVNRTANKNGTPRIMLGKSYTVWVQENFNMGDYMDVAILNPVSLRLYRSK